MGGGQLRLEAVDARVELLPMMPASNFDFCSVCVFRARFTEQGPAVVTGWAWTPKGALGPGCVKTCTDENPLESFFSICS